MRGRKISDTQKQEEQFTVNCRYLGLKLLAEEYRQIVDRANENTVGYYEFIGGIVQAEAVNKQQKHIEYLVKFNLAWCLRKNISALCPSDTFDKPS